MECETRFEVADFGAVAAAAEVPAGELDPLLLHCPQCGMATCRPASSGLAARGPLKWRQCAAELRAQHRIVVIGIGLREDSVLLVRRAIKPRAGYWTLPGGYVENGESMHDAMVREFAEETGAHISNFRLVALYEMPQL